MNTTKTSRTHDLLSHQYRWMRAGWPLAAANAGLFATLILLWSANPSPGQVREWGLVPLWWAAGVAASLGLALVFLALRRRSVVQSARQLDDRLAARNRLETAAALNAATDPIARAQREETAEFLRHAPVKPRHRHLRILWTALLIAFAAHLFTLVAWTRPWRQAARDPVAGVRLPHIIPKASIVWKSPKQETVAAPVEEVPLEAVADSTGGLKDMALVISVNGAQRLDVKVPVDALDKAGKHPVAVSMYFDQLNVEPFDVVSYYLTARRIAPGKLPETTSPVQFVEVKPFRDDVLKGPEMPDQPGTAQEQQEQQQELASITELKIAQLRLIKENFLLAHADLAHDNAAWLAENKRAGSEQGVLETKTGEVVDAMTQLGAPAEIVDLLGQARPFMTDAAGKIVAKENAPALPPQGKSLALITETEKFVRKMLMTGGKAAAAAARPKPNDPFEKQKELEAKMKPRGGTPAGEMELLAQAQAQLSQDVSKDAQQDQENSQAQPGQPQPGQQSDGQPRQGEQKSPSQQGRQGQEGRQQGGPGQNPDEQQDNSGAQPVNGTPAEREAQIDRRLGALLKAGAFSPGVAQHLGNGQKSAREALQQINAGDPSKSREPAAEAARELQLAVATMNQQGGEKAQQQLDAALRALNDAADQARNAPRQNSEQAAREMAQRAGDAADRTKQSLARAAQQEQETGSAEMAGQLSDLARALNAQALRDELDKLQHDPRNTAAAGTAADDLQSLADRTARKPGQGGPSPAEIEALAQRLDRERKNLERLAAQAGSPQGGPQNSGTSPSQAQGNGPGTGPGSGSGKGEGETKGEKKGSGNSGGAGGMVSRNDDITTHAGVSQGGATSHEPLPPIPSQAGHPVDRGDTNTPDGVTTSLPASDHELFARELIEDLRDDTTRAMVLLSGTGQIKEVRDALATPAGSDIRGNVINTAQKVDAPLEGVINLLRAEIQRAQRQHLLTESDPGNAPAAYRTAVADYFEQLSRDYQKSQGPPAPASSPQ